MNLDLSVQSTLYVATLLCALLSCWWPILHLGYLFVLPLAFFQLISGLYYGVGKQSAWHKTYLNVAVFYSSLVPFLLLAMGLFFEPPWVFGYVIVFILPMFIASAYLYKSWHYHHPSIPSDPAFSRGDPMLLDDWHC